jgi:hypothetical protein
LENQNFQQPLKIFFFFFWATLFCVRCMFYFLESYHIFVYIVIWFFVC